MKKTKRAHTGSKKAHKASIGRRGLRDLELLDPGAKKLKGGTGKRTDR